METRKSCTDDRQSSADAKEESRVGLGKSPKSFRKSFPLRKTKKATDSEKNDPSLVAESKLTRSETYDKLNTDNPSTAQSPDSDLTADGRMSPVDTAEVHHSSADDVDKTLTQPAGSKSFKGLNFFKRFTKDSKDKSKDDRTAESESGQPKKKGFSLWNKRDHSSSGKKTNKKKTGADGEWIGRSDGVVKSATLPANVSVRASRSSESLSAIRVSNSATTEPLVSSSSPQSRRVSNHSASSDLHTLNPSPRGPSASSSRSPNPFTEVTSDTESHSPQINCTSMVTTV